MGTGQHETSRALLPGIGSGSADMLAELERDLSDRYVIRVDGRDPGRALRYVAIARQLGIQPYAVVTPDPAELRAAVTRAPASCGPDRDGTAG
jgi:thiamine pyrophosphate-dependent acetolactate synthase large subunit-like protein